MRDGHEERRRKAKDDTGEAVEVVEPGAHACDGDFLGRAGLVLCRTRGSWGSRGTMVVNTS